VARAQSKAERRKMLETMYMDGDKMQSVQQTSNLYLKHLSEDVTEDMLAAEFSKHGTVVSCKIMVDERGISRGFGFVTMSNPEEATKALNETHKKLFHGKVLYVAMHERKDIRQRKIEAFQMQMMRGQMPQYPGVMQQPMPDMAYMQPG
jgi:polyadenylate-binding protein